MLTPIQTTSNHAPDSHYGHFINNQSIDGESGETIDSLSPANGACLPNPRRDFMLKKLIEQELGL